VVVVFTVVVDSGVTLPCILGEVVGGVIVAFVVVTGTNVVEVRRPVTMVCELGEEEGEVDISLLVVPERVDKGRFSCCPGKVKIGIWKPAVTQLLYNPSKVCCSFV